jgi:hypothetical protein
MALNFPAQLLVRFIDHECDVTTQASFSAAANPPRFLVP